MLGVREGYALPENIRHCVGWDKYQYLYAEFLVCPLAGEHDGYMQPVCVESASKLVLERFSDYTTLKRVGVRRLSEEECSAQ